MSEKKSAEYYRTRGDNEFGGNYVEYSVECKSEGKLKLRKLWLILAYIGFVVLYVVLFVVLTKIVPLIAILPLLLWILIFFTWRYTQVEYEYAILQGAFNFSVIYGNRTRKELLEVKIKDMTTIAPYEGEMIARTEAPDIKHLYSFISSKSSPDIYAAIWQDEEGEKSALLFEATNKTLKICKFYNNPATVVKEMRY